MKNRKQERRRAKPPHSKGWRKQILRPRRPPLERGERARREGGGGGGLGFGGEEIGGLGFCGGDETPPRSGETQARRRGRRRIYLNPRLFPKRVRSHVWFPMSNYLHYDRFATSPWTEQNYYKFVA